MLANVEVFLRKVVGISPIKYISFPYRNTFWTWQEAKAHVKLAYTAWDMSDVNGANDVTSVTITQLFCLPGTYTDLYPEVRYPC